MVAKFLDDNKPKTSLIKWIRRVSNFIDLVKCWQNFLGLNPKRPYLSLQKEKENFMLTYFVKRVRNIRKFHVAVMQRRLRTYKKNVMHVQGCCFADINLLLFTFSVCCHRRRCLSSLLLWYRNFATMVTWRHTSLYWCATCLGSTKLWSINIQNVKGRQTCKFQRRVRFSRKA